ncbi:hypothetical protein Q8F55_007150 [Vanrija albida]|uniref:Glycosyltransferase family 18 catalytic domain-containing protein n=1 Tax=Vanrija albida TaxID=181172 RepID=A0ABR3PZI2_9TREE
MSTKHPGMSSTRARSRRALALVLLLAVVASLALQLGALEAARTRGAPWAAWAFAVDECEGWEPHGAPEDDPPACLRARQFRQIQAFRAAEGTEWKLGNSDLRARAAIDRLERCVLGIVACPARPLVLGDFWYIYVKGSSESGEAVWLGDVQDAVEEQGYVYLALMPDLKRAYKNWAPTRLLSELVHQYWTDADHAFHCLSDPRCVRAEDYTPATNETQRHDVSAVKEHEFGRLPAWRVIGVSFWGSRPLHYDGAGINAGVHFGKVEGEEWAWHTLGQRWQIAPYNYPGHSYLPLSIEQRCLQSPVTPHAERENAVLILAKDSAYFSYRDYLTSAWPAIITALTAAGIEVWSTAKEVPGRPIPDGIKKLGVLTPTEYVATVGRAKALLGIGLPEISPSPYVAMCKATPVVMPYWTAQDSEWAQFSSHYQQHGPVNGLGEPHAYTYDIHNTTQMVAQVVAAVATPIAPFVPADMTMHAVRERTWAFLARDWEADYDEVVRANGGVPPAHSDTMRDRCFASGKCKVELLAGHEPEDKAAA